MGYGFPAPPPGTPEDPDLIYPGRGMQGAGDRGYDEAKAMASASRPSTPAGNPHAFHPHQAMPKASPIDTPGRTI
eukprot:2637983-Karenia_brevis.AAC.1